MLAAIRFKSQGKAETHMRGLEQRLGIVAPWDCGALGLCNRTIRVCPPPHQGPSLNGMHLAWVCFAFKFWARAEVSRYLHSSSINRSKDANGYDGEQVRLYK
jgi:hypothetical protein